MTDSPTDWPLWDLAIQGQSVTLRVPTDEELQNLASISVGRILPPEQSLFLSSWASLSEPEFTRGFLEYHRQQRVEWSTNAWSLQCGVYVPQKTGPIGVVGLMGNAFGQTRQATTGSWLLPEWRGHGYGIAARATMLSFLFDHLHGEVALSSAHIDNAPSRAVSASLGYEQIGVRDRGDHRGNIPSVELRLHRDMWQPRESVSVTGFYPQCFID